MMLNYRKHEKIVDTFESVMIESRKISEVKLRSDERTLKEIIGHLTDSASNNHQRFASCRLIKQSHCPDMARKSG